jgi:3-oxoacyl-[acyl-carrier protein] reductase
MSGSLADRIAIVTGAGQGIGLAIARELSRVGATVVVFDIRQEAAEKAARSLGNGAVAYPVDVTDSRQVNASVSAVVERLGQVDILVNNAGILGGNVRVEDTPDDLWDSVIDRNLKSVFLCSRAVVGPMSSRGSGSIISMASVAGKEGNPGMAPYSVSKAGIICFTKSLAKEVVGKGIRVNCVSPALTDTEMAREMDPLQLAYVTSKVPMGRLAKPEEVAAIVRFLASGDSSFVTGQCYDVSGGRSNY